MAEFAHREPIFHIEEQGPISFVGNDVMDHIRRSLYSGCLALLAFTERALPEKPGPSLDPRLRLIHRGMLLVALMTIVVGPLGPLVLQAEAALFSISGASRPPAR